MYSKAYENMIRYALGILAKKRYTEAGMREKLEKFWDKWKRKFGDEAGASRRTERDEEAEVGAKNEVVERVIARLYELKYLDDEQFALDFVMDRVKFRPRGKFLLKKELFAKKVSSETIDKIIEEAEIDEEKLAKDALERYSGKLDKIPKEKRRDRAYQHLAYRGFKPDAIYKAIKHWYNPVEE